MTAPSRTADKIMLRLPDGLRDELKQMARDGYRTMNGQVIMLIERGLAAEKAASNPTA